MSYYTATPYKPERPELVPVIRLLDHLEEQIRIHKTILATVLDPHNIHVLKGNPEENIDKMVDVVTSFKDEIDRLETKYLEKDV
jgi:archaellum component FlaC